MPATIESIAHSVDRFFNWFDEQTTKAAATPRGQAFLAAGYYVWHSGGHCLAWRKEFDALEKGPATDEDGPYALVTDEGGSALPDEAAGDLAWGGFYESWEDQEGTMQEATMDHAALIAALAADFATFDARRKESGQ